MVPDANDGQTSQRRGLVVPKAAEDVRRCEPKELRLRVKDVEHVARRQRREWECDAQPQVEAARAQTMVLRAEQAARRRDLGGEGRAVHGACLPFAWAAKARKHASFFLAHIQIIDRVEGRRLLFRLRRALLCLAQHPEAPPASLTDLAPRVWVMRSE